MSDLFNSIIDKSRENGNKNISKNTYLKDGLLYCGKCNKAKQTVIEVDGINKIFPITCDCDKNEEAAFNERMRKQRWERYIKSLYNQGLTDKAYRKSTFQNDDNRNPEVTALCKKYVSSWKKQKEHHNGILFFGDTDGGKSFYACCIANALIEKGVRVYVGRLSDLVNNRIGNDIANVKLTAFELIVLDDVGVENATQTAYNIIDDIYKNSIPLIVTTNLTPTQLTKPDTLDKKRIYSRICQMCCIPQPVKVTKSRIDIAKQRKAQALKDLNL